MPRGAFLRGIVYGEGNEDARDSGRGVFRGCVCCKLHTARQPDRAVRARLHACRAASFPRGEEAASCCPDNAACAVGRTPVLFHPHPEDGGPRGGAVRGDHGDHGGGHGSPDVVRKLRQRGAEAEHGRHAAAQAPSL